MLRLADDDFNGLHVRSIVARLRWLVDGYGDIVHRIYVAIGCGDRIGFSHQVAASGRCAHCARICRALHVLVLVEPPPDLSAKAGGTNQDRHHQRREDHIAARFITNEVTK